MRLELITRFFLLAALLVSIRAQAQTCSGSLGDPVINQTFGSGTNPGLGLPSSITNMKYTNDNCPEDGYYTIVNAVNLNPTQCHTTWHTVAHDHTNDPNGYMMLINASYEPSIFFTQTANGLCPNTTYEFSAYILNLITLAATGQSTFIEPNITFTVETKDGTVLATYNTGIIPPTADPTWVKYGTYFVTPPGVTDVVVRMNNNAPGGIGNDLVLDDIAFRACGPIVQTGFGDLSSTADRNICQGDNASYKLTSAVGTGYNNPFLRWQLNRNNTNWVNIPNETGPTLNITINNAVPGVYQYRLSVGEGQNINSPSCFVASSPLTVNVNPLPDPGILAVSPACEGQPLILSATAGADSYEWTGPNGFSSTSQNAIVSQNAGVNNAGQYTLKVTTRGCPAFANTDVVIYPAIVPGISPDVAICAGESTQLNATGGSSYKWSPSTGLDRDDVANPVANPLITTIYKVAIGNQGCTDSSKAVTVTVNNNPLANAGSNQTIFEGQAAQLNGMVAGNNITSYYWSPPDFLDNPNALTPVATPTHDITYTLHVLTSTCGQALSNVTIRVYQKVTIPNTFTPNGDGINDYWNIKKLSTYPDCLITVYSRDGQQVYKSIGYVKPWDGTYNNSPVPGGIYYYIIDLNDGQPKLSGWVLVMR